MCVSVFVFARENEFVVCCYRTGRSLGTSRERNVLYLLWLLLRRVSYFQVDYRYDALWYFYKYEHAAHTRINSYTGLTHTHIHTVGYVSGRFALLFRVRCWFDTGWVTGLFDVQVKASHTVVESIISFNATSQSLYHSSPFARSSSIIDESFQINRWTSSNYR